jgi:hypothetical protein
VATFDSVLLFVHVVQLVVVARLEAEARHIAHATGISASARPARAICVSVCSRIGGAETKGSADKWLEGRCTSRDDTDVELQAAKY